MIIVRMASAGSFSDIRFIFRCVQKTVEEILKEMGKDVVPQSTTAEPEHAGQPDLPGLGAGAKRARR